jgi:hypothetical protein
MALFAPRPEELTNAMTDALIGSIRDALKARILERLEPDLNAAVDAGMETFKTTIAAWKDHASYDTIIKVILEDRRQSTS